MLQATFGLAQLLDIAGSNVTNAAMAHEQDMTPKVVYQTFRKCQGRSATLLMLLKLQRPARWASDSHPLTKTECASMLPEGEGREWAMSHGLLSEHQMLMLSLLPACQSTKVEYHRLRPCLSVCSSSILQASHRADVRAVGASLLWLFLEGVTVAVVVARSALALYPLVSILSAVCYGFVKQINVCRSSRAG